MTTAPWRVGDPDPTPVLPTNDGYCFAPFYPLGAHHTYRCSWPLGEEHPGWHVAADQLGRAVAVWPVAPPPEDRAIAPRDRHPTDPTVARRPGESAPKWTDRLVQAGAAGGINRQCSIGYHDECSDRDADAADDGTCRCLCHAGPSGLHQ